MFGIFNSDPPRYHGAGQPNGCSQGPLGRLARVVNGAKPAYRGTAQGATSSGLFGWFSGTPAYRTPSPVAEPVAEAPSVETMPAPAPEPESGEWASEPELEAHCVAEGNGEGDVELEHGEPLLARVPVTIVIRRGEA